MPFGDGEQKAPMSNVPVPMRIGKTIKNLNRVREIIQVLLKNGFEDLVANTPLKNFIPEGRKLTWLRDEKAVMDLSHWEIIRLTTEELGPTFIKFAQILSNRPDVLPLPLIHEFEKLQSSVPPFSSDKARSIIFEETGKTTEELFEYFLDKPVGSASIGQVHRAKLKEGPEVVVKVQRPDIRKVIENDLSIMQEIAVRGEAYFERIGIPNILDIIETFTKTMGQELDYGIEARNMAQFRAFYRNTLKFKVPEVFPKYSTSKILISEYISACKVTDIETQRSWGLDPEKIAKDGIQIYLSQIFEYGLFHADPHPGNVLVMKNGTIALIDYGMVGNLQKKDKFAFAGIFIGLAQRDARKVAGSLRQLAIDDGIGNRKLFDYQIGQIINDFSGLDVSQGSISELGRRLQQIIHENKMKLPGSVFLILRALAILEGIGKQISPNLNIYEIVKPYGAKLVAEQFSTENLLEELAYRLTTLDNFSRKIPNELISFFQMARKGELVLNVNDQKEEYRTKQQAKSMNRLIMGMITCTLFLGSAWVYSVEVQGYYQFGSWPIVSAIGFILSLVSGIWLVFKMLINR